MSAAPVWPTGAPLDRFESYGCAFHCMSPTFKLLTLQRGPRWTVVDVHSTCAAIRCSSRSIRAKKSSFDLIVLTILTFASSKCRSTAALGLQSHFVASTCFSGLLRVTRPHFAFASFLPWSSWVLPLSHVVTRCAKPRRAFNRSARTRSFSAFTQTFQSSRRL